MDIEERLSRENCEGCATSCKLSAPSCPFGTSAAAERREELEQAESVSRLEAFEA